MYFCYVMTQSEANYACDNDWVMLVIYVIMYLIT